MYETPLANRGFRCNDSTVPFPTAAISLVDPFENYDTSGIAVDEDDDHVVKSWHMPGQDEVMFAGGREAEAKIPAILALSAALAVQVCKSCIQSKSSSMTWV